MKRILLTGMSGVGKSTLLSRIRDDNTICLDLDETDYLEFDLKTGERRICVERLVSYLDTVTDKNLVLAVCEANQGQIYPLMDAVILLTAPLEVMKERINARQDNTFGKDEAEWRRIVNDKREIEPLLMKSADYVIQTDGKLEEVLEKVERIMTVI
ncbi:MAG: AAA family ATPase [Peptostreptococcaceae bacterium]|nr:AAA family ATPase [Peptostreptococcaceae bacterium]